MATSPTADEIGAEHRANLIRELAGRLYPEDGYETDAENRDAELFSLIVEAVRVYSQDDTTASVRVNIETTLMAVGENLLDSQVIVTT